MTGNARAAPDGLVLYEAACRAVAELKTVDEVKDIRDKAVALAAYARQAKNRGLEADAVEIRMRATRRVDELRLAQKKSVGLATGARGLGTSDAVRGIENPAPTLASQGIDKNLAKQARSLGSLSPAQFEGAVAHARDAVSRAVKTAVRQSIIEAESDDPAGSAVDGCTVEDLNALIALGRKFGVIYADPPWEFKVYSGKGKQRSAERHYDTMTIDELKALAVAALAADNCALFLWGVWPEQAGALEVIKAWGFTYKTAGFVWVKQNRGGEGLFTGMGYWTRANTEPCLFATKGAPQRLAMDVPQVIMSPVSEHSRKPDEARVRIERLVGGPYLELFGRRAAPGWTVWGDQVERSLLHHALDLAEGDGQ